MPGCKQVTIVIRPNRFPPRDPEELVAVGDDLPLIGQAHDEVGFGQLRTQFISVALGQAAGDDEAPAAPVGLEVSGLQDRGDGFLFGRLDEAAGVDDDEVGLLGRIREPIAVELQKPVHPFGIHRVFRASECDQVHLVHATPFWREAVGCYGAGPDARRPGNDAVRWSLCQAERALPGGLGTATRQEALPGGPAESSAGVATRPEQGARRGCRDKNCLRFLELCVYLSTLKRMCLDAGTGGKRSWQPGASCVARGLWWATT